MLLTSLAFAADLDSTQLATGLWTGLGGLRIERPTSGEAGELAGGVAIPFQLLPSGATPWWDTDVGLTIGGTWTPVKPFRVDARITTHPLLFGEGYVGAGLGDVQLGATAILVDGDHFGLNLRPTLRLPTGTWDWGLGAGAPTTGLDVTAEMRPDGEWFMDLNVGAGSAPASDWGGATLGNEVHGGLGMGVAAFGTTVIGAELTGEIAAAGGVDPLDLDVEIHGYGSFALTKGWVLTAAAGRRLSEAPGAPDLRLLAGLSYVKPGEKPVVDLDGDGLLDTVDRCVRDAEDRDGFEDQDGCPDPDNDRDGKADATDKCPKDAEDLDSFQDDDGCPEPDNDGDTVLDVDDDCPELKGAIRAMGCPDRDEDAVADQKDRCPDVRGDRYNDGCPENAAPTQGTKLDVPDPIRFETGTATLLPESEAVLSRVVALLVGHSELKRVEVAGHTDSQGSDAANLALSQARATTVVNWLVAHGVDRSRLVAKGYGETTPVDTNATESGRALNRRVEFVVLK